MSDLEKALLHTDGDRVDITVPITKVRPEARTVVGFATTDAVDHADEVVTFAASKKAFASTKARIREQHSKTGGAVGKIVKFEAKTVWSEQLNKVVNAIEVEAYISETAPDTWTKAKEGLFGGFSIGGYTRKSEERIAKDANGKPTNKVVKYITDYELTELSLVDNPCNPLATILEIKKADNGDDIIKGMVADVETENVFWNSDTRELKVSKDDEIAGFENIGWIETSKSLDDEIRSEQLTALLQNHLSLVKSNEGGATNMPEEIKEEVVTEETVVEEVEAPAAEETAEVPAETEQAVEVEEVPADDTDIQKMIEDLRSTFSSEVEKAVSTSNEHTNELIKSVNEKLEKFSTEVIPEISALKSQYEELHKSVETAKAEVVNVQKSIESLEADTAIKKSSDLGGSKEIRKSGTDWGGHFSVGNLGN